MEHDRKDRGLLDEHIFYCPGCLYHVDSRQQFALIVHSSPLNVIYIVVACASYHYVSVYGLDAYLTAFCCGDIIGYGVAGIDNPSPGGVLVILLLKDLRPLVSITHQQVVCGGAILVGHGYLPVTQ